MKNILVCLCLILVISCKTETSKTLKTSEIAAVIPVKEIVKKPIFTDFIYDINPRFSTVKKSEIDKARSINDFLDTEITDKIRTLKSVTITKVESDRETSISEKGTTKQLNTAQLELLKSFGYNTNFVIRADFMEYNKHTNQLNANYNSPYLTVIPEHQAEYSLGKKALKTYFKNQTEAVRAKVIPEKLQAAKLYFIVTKKGTIEHIRLDRSSNYPQVDKKMIDLLSNLPGSWSPAVNDKGQKVSQELVISFGLMGC